MKKKLIEEGGSFWKKMKNSDLTWEEFERVEELECCIIDCENRIDEWKKEEAKILREAKKRKKNDILI